MKHVHFVGIVLGVLLILPAGGANAGPIRVSAVPGVDWRLVLPGPGANDGTLTEALVAGTEDTLDVAYALDTEADSVQTEPQRRGSAAARRLTQDFDLIPSAFVVGSWARGGGLSVTAREGFPLEVTSAAAGAATLTSAGIVPMGSGLGPNYVIRPPRPTPRPRPKPNPRPVPPPPQPVSEPASILLLATGLLGLAGAVHLRSRNRH